MRTILKFVGWMKGHWKLLAGIITVAITIFGGIQSCRANKWEAEALRLDGKLEEQVADQDKLYAEAAGARKERAMERAAERLKREGLEADIQRLTREGERAKRALAQEKKKTAKLPPTEMAEELDARVGPKEVSLGGSGLYLFTRVGAERTLNRFRDGEFHLAEYGKYQQVLKEHKLEVDSFNTSIASCEETVAKNLKGWDDCRETLATAQQDIAALQKVKASGVWKGRLQGGAIAITFIALLKVCGAW